MMARRVYFSFHYGNDSNRANVVRNCDMISRQYDGVVRFQDKSLWDEVQGQGAAATKRFIDRGLEGSSVTCVLIGQQTWQRQWVRYEILASLSRNNGIFGVNIHDVGFDPGGGRTSLLFGARTILGSAPPAPGLNPFRYLGYTINAATGMVTFHEIGPDMNWRAHPDVAPVARASIKILPLGGEPGNLEKLFQVYGWNAGNGRANIAAWIETAALRAGR